METTHIYTLSDPETGKVRYVGKSDRPADRLKSHISSITGSSGEKSIWLNSLKNKNMKPVLNIIENVPVDKWIERERHWILHYSKTCDLVNIVHVGSNSSSYSGKNKRFSISLEIEYIELLKHICSVTRRTQTEELRIMIERRALEMGIKITKS